MKNKIALFLTILIAATTLSADDPPVPPPSGRGTFPGDSNGARPGRGERSGRRGGGMTEMLEELRAQYPDEVAELENLRGDRQAFFAKMQELRAKAGLSSHGRPGERNFDRDKPIIKDAPDSPLDVQMASRIDAIKERDPDLWADIELLLASEPEKGWELLARTFENYRFEMPADANIHNVKFNLILPRDVVRVTMERVNRELKRKFPEEYSQLEILRVSNPALARLRFTELVKKGNISTKLVVPITEIPDIPKPPEEEPLTEEIPAGEVANTPTTSSE